MVDRICGLWTIDRFFSGFKMKIITSPVVAQRYFVKLKKCGKTIGFVPTMGALHEGHLSLIKRARKENALVVVSIFINPAQFGKNEDFEKYPRTFRQDKKICRQTGVDIIFYPSTNDIYKQEHLTFVEVKNLSDILCGKFRPGHFRGVTTVVLKLFNIIQPTRAYFGTKDFQQLKIIEKMVDDLNIPVKIISCPTIREKFGLAFSSRNKYLSTGQKLDSALIYKAISDAKVKISEGYLKDIVSVKKYITKAVSKISGINLEYVEIVDPKTLTNIEGRISLKNNLRILIAAKVGRTRLIDNV